MSDEHAAEGVPVEERRGAMVTIRGVTVLLAVALAAAACEDDPVNPDGSVTRDELEDLGPGIHTVLSIPGLDDWTPDKVYQVRLHLKKVEVEGEVSSYQGELLFDESVIEVLEAGFPEGLMGAWNQTKPGVIRFAGVTLEAVGIRPALELLVTSSRPLRPGDFRVKLEEVIATEAYENLTSAVVGGDRPLLTREELGTVAR